MTNKEYLIKSLHNLCDYVNINVVEEVYKIINEYDWAVFCSQMGDYDHPTERVQAEKVMNEKLDELSNKNEKYAKAVSCIKQNLTEDISKLCDFYSRNFHNMNKEYVK